MKKLLVAFGFSALLLSSCGNGTGENALQKEAQDFIDGYTEKYVQLYTNSSEAQWRSNIEIKEGDSTNMLAAQKADEEMAAFTGSKENIDNARKYLDQADQLTDIQ